ncbi:tripartite tricarboxylate transporter substrate binding protein [Spirochaetia bacterium 38H-sp]|uniref:Tripartite tricarboxylate transporter substrate binding protein n=1 Tax=Rarispira pelagica TaxID=3141764 RepID=A0ABU9UAH3_9SPIR
MKRSLLTALILLLVAGFAIAQPDQEYPARDITDIVVWGAGGGTDTCNRVIMAELSKALGVNINVINKTGGVAGSAGMLEAYSKPADGYTLVGLSESCVTAAVQGGWDKRMNVWDFFIVGGSPDVVSVNANAPYNTLEELIDAAKANPGSIKAGASGAGSIHHLNLLALMKGTGAEFNFIPYPGSAPSQNAALSGEVTVIVTSVAEQAQLIRGGKFKPLAVLVPDDFPVGDKIIPSALKKYPELNKYLPLMQAIGFAIRKDAPENVKATLRAAFNEAMKSASVKKFAEENFYILSGLSGEEAGKVFDNLESNFAWTLWDLGAAKVDPASLGIPKP